MRISPSTKEKGKCEHKQHEYAHFEIDYFHVKLEN